MDQRESSIMQAQIIPRLQSANLATQPALLMFELRIGITAARTLPPLGIHLNLHRLEEQAAATRSLKRWPYPRRKARSI